MAKNINNTFDSYTHMVYFGRKFENSRAVQDFFLILTKFSKEETHTHKYIYFCILHTIFAVTRIFVCYTREMCVKIIVSYKYPFKWFISKTIKKWNKFCLKKIHVNNRRKKKLWKIVVFDDNNVLKSSFLCKYLIHIFFNYK